MMDKAIRVETGIKGLSISIGDDGLWLNFENNVDFVSLHLATLVSGGVGDKMIQQWIIETKNHYCNLEIETKLKEEEEQQRLDDNGQFGVGA